MLFPIPIKADVLLRLRNGSNGTDPESLVKNCFLIEMHVGDEGGGIMYFTVVSNTGEIYNGVNHKGIKIQMKELKKIPKEMMSRFELMRV